MATTRIFSLLQILLMALLCRATSIRDPLLVAETSTSAAALTQTQGPALDSPKITVLVTYRRNQTGHLVAQVKLEDGDNKGQTSSAQTETASNSKASVANSAPGQQQLSDVIRYSFHTTGKNWDEARRICDQEGGHLAIINSETEWRVLHDLYALAPVINDVVTSDWAFIGFHDRFVEGEFLTIQGKPLESTGFTLWDSSEPSGNEDCGSISRNGGLNDIYCSYRLAFFCEQES